MQVHDNCTGVSSPESSLGLCAIPRTVRAQRASENGAAPG
jgi:hypothetical protein